MSPTVVILTIAAYFALLIAVSAIVSRRADSSAFFTGGRKAPWPVVAFAMAGAAISGVTFISVPGMVPGQGYAYLQMVLGFIVGYVVIAVVLVPMFYRRNLVSIYEYLGQRFGRNSHSAGSWMFFISKMSGASVRFFVVCAVLQVLVFDPLGIPFALNVTVTVALIWLIRHAEESRRLYGPMCSKVFASYLRWRFAYITWRGILESGCLALFLP